LKKILDEQDQRSGGKRKRVETGLGVSNRLRSREASTAD
jgi:hypothetical protein